MNPKASVIIPVYNAEKTLRRCVESLTLGLERDVEVILCEDRSKDGSWQVCRDLAQEYQNVRCIRNEKNRGVSFTRNAALHEAKGEYLLFVDSDDWVSQKYVAALIKLAQNNPGMLAICGHHFIDKVHGTKRDYLWSDDPIREVTVGKTGLFDLCDQFLLQQLWNKIFRRDLIEMHRIRFDETQSMGEDFQFVLDYMEAAQIKKCVILNEPLYYYIRWNNASLMSKFGFIDSQPEFDRMEQLARIAGSDAQARKDAMIEQSKRNYIYHIARNTGHSRQEKLDAIERIRGDGKASFHYRQQRVQFAKERLAAQLMAAKQLVPRLKGRLQRSQTQKRIEEAVEGVHAEGVTFLSQNCIGGVLYHDLGMPFLSPTINVFIPEPGFVKMALNLRYYMQQELVVHWGEEYPIGMLDDVQIHFMHYDTCLEAKESWERRKKRINWERIFVIGTDRDGFDGEVYAQWKQIPYPKILFTANAAFTEDAVYFPEFAADGAVGDLIARRLFYRGGAMLKKAEEIEKSVKEDMRCDPRKRRVKW